MVLEQKLYTSKYMYGNYLSQINCDDTDLYQSSGRGHLLSLGPNLEAALFQF